MLYASQLRAARSLLGWSQQELADKSGVGIATIRRMEPQTGPVRGISDTVWRLQGCLEDAGVMFIEDDGVVGPGVRLTRSLHPK